MIYIAIKISKDNKVFIDMLKQFPTEQESVKFCKRLHEITKYFKHRCTRIGLEETCYNTSLDIYTVKISTERQQAMIGDIVEFKGKRHEVVGILKNHFYKTHPTEKKLNAFGQEVPVIINVGTCLSGIIERNGKKSKVSFDKCVILKRKYPELWTKEDSQPKKTN